ncbi:hypothetical protein AD949_10425 [Acetobacter orleanensis]|nr:hypothetical protein AD949_10425 [Acetobacter orleanensis]PCD80180.1 hypothetical protein CO710_04065 [Acetobacter orleanensis]
MLVTAGVLCLTGCSHKDPLDTTLDWMQHMRGGVIASQRPPPPGIYDPYPHVGLTPTTTPDVPSPQARTLITQQLIRDRNLTYRTVAANGTLMPQIPPPPGAAAAPKKAATPAQGTNVAPQPATLPEGTSGAIMDAAEAPSDQAATQTGATAGKNGKPTLPSAKSPGSNMLPGAGKTARQTTDGEQKDAEVAMPEIGMPEVKSTAQTQPTPPSAIPQIPSGPPAPPAFPGFDVPSDAYLPDAIRPNYDLSDAKGTAIHCVPQSDQISSGQDDTFTKLVAKTPHGPFYVRGFGSAASLDAQDQADAVQLGLLRAQTIAKKLISLNVPASAIHIRGDAFGMGARIATTP